MTHPRICLFANTFSYPSGGGHLWVYLNWALGARGLGLPVIWLEGVDLRTTRGLAELDFLITALKTRLKPYGLADALALWSWTGEPLPGEAAADCLGLDAAAESDVLLNFEYFAPAALVARFRRSVLVDIDPGLLQSWVSAGQVPLAPHDLHVSTGETVGRPGARFPDVGKTWHYSPPCVALDWWPVHPAPAGAAFTAVSHWEGDRDYMVDEEGVYTNSKKAGFFPFQDLPARTGVPLELALCLAEREQADRRWLRERGWRLRDADQVAGTPWDYQSYIQNSRGEFGWAKPSCLRFQNAWVSDRTLCYLASGKPAVVRNTGPSRILPDASGLFRYDDLEGAVRCLERVAADYDSQSRRARELAEEWFDARRAVRNVLERACS